VRIGRKEKNYTVSEGDYSHGSAKPLSRRSALGTVLDANSPAIAMINRGETYYGDATIFGKPYATGYEPIKDASGNVIGIYFVGYMK
jgi:hypothetical protein